MLSLKTSRRLRYEADAILGQRFDDSALFGFGLYGSSCYYGAWSLVYAALGCIVLGALIAAFTQRCPFCRRYLGMMFFTGGKTYCPHCGSDVHTDRNV